MMILWIYSKMTSNPFSNQFSNLFLPHQNCIPLPLSIINRTIQQLYDYIYENTTTNERGLFMIDFFDLLPSSFFSKSFYTYISIILCYSIANSSLLLPPARQKAIIQNWWWTWSNQNHSINNINNNLYSIVYSFYF